MDTWYEDEAEVARRVAAGDHRDIIGGMWDEIGALQFAWLVSQGMQPWHTLLDVGCGSGRLAVKAAPYLRPGNYYGQDISPALLSAARSELAAIGCAGVAPENFLSSATFDAPGNRPFDFIMAQSVFTHLSLPRFRQCLDNLAGRIAPSGRFFATFFLAPYSVMELLHERGGVTTFADRDPYHYTADEVLDAAAASGWLADIVGEWAHPRDQQMVVLTR